MRRGTDADDLSGWLAGRWGGTLIAVHGELYDAARLSALVARRGAELVGVLTYAPAGDLLEVVTCDAEPAGRGVGRLLVAAAVTEARRLKPQIPERGWRGLPIRDEIDLELTLPVPDL